MRKVTVSTRNPEKVTQIRQIFDDTHIDIVSLDDAGIQGKVNEDATTLEGNALKKARFAWDIVRDWAIADDTGLFIDILGGQPGIHTARWAGEDATTEEIMNFTLNKLRGLPKEVRGATFRTFAVVISPEGEETIFEGSVRGSILTEPRTKCQPNMPYSAIFVPFGSTKVWAEMTTQEENIISHRGKAFRQVVEFLRNKK